MVRCAFCKSEFACISHFKIHLPCRHGGSVYSRLVCGEDNCGRTFSEWVMFRKHLKYFHKCDGTNTSNQYQFENQLVISNNVDNVDAGFVDGETGDDADVDLSVADFKSKYDKSVEVLIAKLYRNPSIPRNFVQTLIDDIHTFLTDGFIDVLKSKVLSSLKVANAEEAAVSEIDQLLNIMQDPFSGLSTDYRRMKHFKDNNCYVPPVEYIISESRPKTFNTSTGPVVKQVKTTGQYVPFRYVLKKLFELPGALSSTLQFMDYIKTCPANVKINVIQSCKWQQKVSLFGVNAIVIPLHFYFDEVEPNADLGPHSEKIGAGYILIPVLPPSCQSKLENILLALLFDADDRKSCTPGKVSYNEEVFKPIVKECNFLEKKGILCNVPDLGEKRLFFVLDRIIGDNLGLHGILGFSEGFTSNFPCIVCRAPKLLTQSMTLEDPSLYRTRAMYDADLLIQDKSQTGIKEACTFNKISSFHVVDNMSVDVMHDMAEGVSHYVLISVIKHCVDSKFFSISTLNSRIFFFDYGPVDSSNKPVGVADDFHTKSKLRGSAKEIMSLVRLLGALVGDLVPHFDRFWHLYLLHKQIMEICNSRVLPVEVASELDLLVHEHHSLYLELLPERTLAPKFHYLTHLGARIRDIGPPVQLSSIRGEAKHRQVVTLYASAMTCRKNTPLSLAKKHQLGLCFRFVADVPLVPEMVCGPSENIELEDHQYFVQFRSKLPLPVKCEGTVQRVNWAEVSGTIYKPRMVLVLGVNDATRFKFGRIVDIFIISSRPLFICKLLTNVGFCDHVGGFEVSQSSRFACVFHDDLYDPFPLYDFQTNSGDRFVVLKQYL